MKKYFLFLFVFICCFPYAQEAEIETVAETIVEKVTIRPPEIISIEDYKYDNGARATVTFKLSPDDNPQDQKVAAYLVQMSTGETMIMENFKDYKRISTSFFEKEDYEKGEVSFMLKDQNYKLKYWMLIKAIGIDGSQSEPTIHGPFQTYEEWWDPRRHWNLAGCLLFTVTVILFIGLAKRGRKLFVRPIAGIEAVDEAIGRATEMGKPVLYISGLSGISDIATIASINILGPVARKCAEFENEIIVPCYDPIVYTIINEVVRESYVEAGKPDDFKEDSVFFMTTAQFAYAAGVNGIIMRDRPATIFYLGMFFAESLLMAETGNLIGAIQIAGTDAVTQIPFFITSCDYTLIGEELYAASAYLSKEPLLLGTLKAQDYGKLAIMVILAAGLLLEIFGLGGIFAEIFKNIPK